ncbi:sulfite exporter TauE/SafE family protein [Clostridium formicaceticum]|uniref:Probable membrane transporter protein n=1 Tax=Clostridium formicaceticum TaxID=1497 RepID=A0AAC9RHT6_9CLOT|nr:sulfite exporter TauE/SafE family protein [Clostridium formicaceticum]AOY76821.1 permease [Clostridium formicaceticum]ARE87291.1 Sulfite exporter TauE/SafE [Clostridium formicaceticum]
MAIFILGLFAGIIGGMGIGGGTILIPGLIFLTNFKQQTIQSINLISFIPIAIVALIIHVKNRDVLFKLSLPIVLFGLLGAWAGSKLALTLPSSSLRRLFGVFLLIMGVYEILYKDKVPREK